MTINTNAALADIPAAGAKALADYLNECRAHAIQPDIGGAFAYAFSAGAALTTAAAVPPEGWVRVPLEPTKKMLHSAFEMSESTVRAIWRAMLAAAPKAEPVPITPALLSDIRELAAYAEGSKSPRMVRASLAAFAWLEGKNSAEQPAGEYPPLPDPHGLGILKYAGADMRAYVDADRAMRAQAAPAAVTHIQQPYSLAEIKAKIASNDYSAELMLQHAMLLLEKPVAVAGPSEWREALEEALSVMCSVSVSRDRRVVRDGCVLYLQTEEWCKWLEDDVGPKIAALLAAAPTTQASPQPAVQQGDAAHVISAAREAMDESFEAGNDAMDISIPSHLAAALSLALDEYDATHPAAPVAQGDADFEAVRKKLCALQRYSFVLDDDGVVRRVQDRTGNWIEFDDAHELFDPVAVDAAIAAQAKEGA